MKDSYEEHSEEPVADLGFWKPHLDTNYDSEENLVSLLYV